MRTQNFLQFAAGLEAKMDEVLFQTNPYAQDVDENGHPILKTAIGAGVVGGVGYGIHKGKQALDSRIAEATAGMPADMIPGKLALYKGAARSMLKDGLNAGIDAGIDAGEGLGRKVVKGLSGLATKFA